MAGPTNYYVCSNCHKIGVYQSAMMDEWRCRYCGVSAPSKDALTEGAYQCPDCGELVDRQARRAYDVLYRNPVLIPSSDLAAMLEDTTSANDQYVQGMSPNSVFLASIQKLTGVKAQAFVDAVEHKRRYHANRRRMHRKGEHVRPGHLKPVGRTRELAAAN